MIIAVDFDGTCVTHEFPYIGRDIGAALWLRKFVDNGAKLVLNTMRSNQYLMNAVEWFTSNGIALYGVNENPTQKEWTDSPKVYAELYIDDAAFGCPLIARHVNWEIVGPQILKMLEERKNID